MYLIACEPRWSESSHLGLAVPVRSAALTPAAKNDSFPSPITGEGFLRQCGWLPGCGNIRSPGRSGYLRSAAAAPDTHDRPIAGCAARRLPPAPCGPHRPLPARSRSSYARPVKEDDLRALFAVTEDARDKAMFIVMLRCGLRIGETLSIATQPVF